MGNPVGPRTILNKKEGDMRDKKEERQAPPRDGFYPHLNLDFRLAQSARNIWRLSAKAGTLKSDLTDPGFWAHVAGNLTAGDVIEVLTEDFTFFATLLVKSANGRGQNETPRASVYILNYMDLGADVPKLAEEKCVAQWRAKWKWCAVIPNGEVVRRDFATREETQQWINEAFAGAKAAETAA